MDITNSTGIDAFILYTPCVEEWAEKLDVALRKSGVSTWIDIRDLETGASAWEQLEKAASKTTNVVVLAGKKDDATEGQRMETMAAIEAVYENPDKRLVPLLLGQAELPMFVRNLARWTRPIPSLRIADPARDWDRAVADLLEILRGEADPRAKGEVIDTAEEDRRLWNERMDYIRQVVAGMKDKGDRAGFERLSA